MNSNNVTAVAFALYSAKFTPDSVTDAPNGWEEPDQRRKDVPVGSSGYPLNVFEGGAVASDVISDQKND